MFVGLIIIVIGLVLLMQNMGFVGPDIWNVIWPSLIILFGLSLLMKRRRSEERWDRFEQKVEKVGKRIHDRFEEKSKK
jgi:sulfite exporter TauE/SafE